MSQRHDAFAALRHAEFRHLVFATGLLTVGLMAQEVALGYELYRITGNALTLGLVGLAQVLPFVLAALFGGYVADRRERRRLMLLSLSAIFAGALVLVWVTLPATRAAHTLRFELIVIYAVMALLGLARAFYQPAASSLRAFLVPRAQYANASAWSSTFWQGGAIVGPALAGFLIAGFGLTATLLLVAALIVIALLLIWRLSPRPPVPPQAGESLRQNLIAGLQFVWKTPLILYAISLDLISVLFGGVLAILPVFARDILAAGPEGLGILRAAPALGAMLTMLACAWLTPTGRPWRNLLLAVLGFGVATVAFALSGNFWFSAAALFATGAFDAVSVVIRQTLLQVLPPDHMRGRVLAVSGIFVSASNELGAFQSSVLVRLFGAVPGVLLGASATLVCVWTMWRRGRGLLGTKLEDLKP